MRKVVYLAVLALVFTGLFRSDAAAQKSRKAVSASEATGTFRMEFTGKYKGTYNEIRLLPLGKGKIKMAFDLVYPFIDGAGEMSANIGQAEGIGTIDADVAVYENNEYGECRIVLKFIRPGVIKVSSDDGDFACGFGHNVSAAGTYKRTSKMKPKFEDPNK